MLRSSMLLALLAATGYVAPARADTTDCTPITALPATLSAPGTYCLTKSLATGITTGPAILVAAHGVTIDCNSFRLGNLAAGSGTQAVGIQAAARDHVTIRNCHVRGFRMGIALSGRNALIAGNHVSLSTYEGIRVAAPVSVIRGNRVMETGSPTATTAIGIRNNGGAALLVRDNIIAGVTSSGRAYGLLSTGRHTIIESNRISGLVGAGGVRGLSVSQARTVMRGNHIQVKPGTVGYAVLVNDNGEAGQAFCTHNTALGLAGTTPWSACFDHYNNAY